MPHARQMIHDTAFDPDTITLMGEVLYAAWTLARPAFSGQPQMTIHNARAMLARTIIEGVKAGLQHPDILQKEAMGAVRERYPHLRI